MQTLSLSLKGLKNTELVKTRVFAERNNIRYIVYIETLCPI
jgi:hypothetical protein